ncbi:MAG: hypothetical protein EZS28_034289 [Streblomastix strix]|uniref:Tyr recombinase domain-containing protein n=1 Tax=Streblomastix strix TaxID=222440 RepID=A0A5J4UKD0_9EUKA|nr:MAG: hypothetical protein EZS28_034289 [Streblomastix strix]
MRQEEQEIQRSVLIQHCSLGLIVNICIMRWILNKLRASFWQSDGNPAVKRRTCLWLNSILHEIGIRGATTNSFKHAASTEQARRGLDSTNLNIFTHHSVLSRAASNYYIYATNTGINDIASQLVGSHGQSYATQTISQQRSGAIERNDISTFPGFYLQHSGNITLLRSSIAQLLALPFDKTLPVGRGIESTVNTGARSDKCTLINMIMMICLDHKTNVAVGMLTNSNVEEVLIKIYNNNDKKTNNKQQQHWDFLLTA